MFEQNVVLRSSISLFVFLWGAEYKKTKQNVGAKVCFGEQDYKHKLEKIKPYVDVGSRIFKMFKVFETNVELEANQQNFEMLDDFSLEIIISQNSKYWSLVLFRGANNYMFHDLGTTCCFGEQHKHFPNL